MNTETLFEILNNEYVESSNWRIANAILSLKSSIKSVSINDLAELCFVSEATISRFCKNTGFESYQQLKNSIIESLNPLKISIFHMQKQSYELLEQNPKNFMRDYAKKITQNILAVVDTIDYDQIDNLAHEIYSTPRVFLFSHSSSLATSKMIQSNLYSCNKLVYSAESEEKQRSYIDQMKEDDLVIIISTFGHYIHDRPLTVKKIMETKAKSILITQNKGIQEINLFDEVIIFGNDNCLETGTYSILLGLEYFVRRYSIIEKKMNTKGH